MALRKHLSHGPLASIVGASLLLAGATGCSSFGRDWNAAAAIPDNAPLVGRWEGEWRSEVNGHHGRLRALATREDTNRFRIRYQATYAGWLRFGYTMTAGTTWTNADTVHFDSEADLGIWGTYRACGQASATAFNAQYQSRHDRGVFDMKRPGTTVDEEHRR